MSEQEEPQRHTILLYDARKQLEPPARKGRLHATAKPVGAVCNLNCAYCYYLPKKHLLNQPRAPRMSSEMLERYIAQCIEAQHGEEIVFTWHGGEPTLAGLDFFREVIALQKKYQPAGQRIGNDLQTNGTLLTAEWCEFLKEHNFLVGLSIDGPRELHDAQRVDRGGGGSFDQVMRGIELLKKYEVEFSTLTVVNGSNAKHPVDVYRFLRREVETESIQFIPCVEPKTFHTVAPQHWPTEDMPLLGSSAARPGNPDSVVTEWSVPPDDWGYFLSRAFDEWLKKDVGLALVNLFETAVAQLVGLPPQICVTAEFCGKALAVEQDGTAYSCDHYVYPEYALGNIKQTHLGRMAFSQHQEKFGFAKRDRLPGYCRKCEYLGLCWGECPRNRFLRSPEGEPGLNYLCAGIKRFYKHAGPALKRIAEQVRLAET